jgi:hypothetical protein
VVNEEQREKRGGLAVKERKEVLNVRGMKGEKKGELKRTHGRAPSSGGGGEEKLAVAWRLEFTRASLQGHTCSAKAIALRIGHLFLAAVRGNVCAIRTHAQKMLAPGRTAD